MVNIRPDTTNTHTNVFTDLIIVIVFIIVNFVLIEKLEKLNCQRETMIPS